MIFTDLFLGGPAVLERGLQLCAANGIPRPLTELELKRLRWSLPYVGLALCVYRLPSTAFGETLCKMCNLQFDAWIKSLIKPVRLGDFVVTPGELQALADSGALGLSPSADIRDVEIELSALSSMIAHFRFDGLRMILERVKQQRDFEGHSPNLDRTQIEAMAHALGCLVYGYEPDESTLQQKFLIDVVAETQKHIDAILTKSGLGTIRQDG